jgi:cyclin-dependent kinase-like
MLEILEANPDGLDSELVRFFIWQLCRALNFCHKNGIIHRGYRYYVFIHLFV